MQDLLYSSVRRACWRLKPFNSRRIWLRAGPAWHGGYNDLVDDVGWLMVAMVAMVVMMLVPVSGDEMLAVMQCNAPPPADNGPAPTWPSQPAFYWKFIEEDLCLGSWCSSQRRAKSFTSSQTSLSLSLLDKTEKLCWQISHRIYSGSERRDKI